MHRCNFVLSYSIEEHGEPDKDLYLEVRQIKCKYPTDREGERLMPASSQVKSHVRNAAKGKWHRPSALCGILICKMYRTEETFEEMD